MIHKREMLISLTVVVDDSGIGIDLTSTKQLLLSMLDNGLLAPFSIEALEAFCIDRSTRQIYTATNDGYTLNIQELA